MSITTPDAEWESLPSDDTGYSELFHKPTARLVLRMFEERIDDTARSKYVNARDIIDNLSEPFRRDQISKRKMGNLQVDYVEGHEYIARLNAVAPEWSLRMTKSEMVTLNVKRWDEATRKSEPTQLPCLMVYAELEIPGVGTRAGIGVQMIEDNAGEDVMKGALTDAFKNCCKYFNLGLHLYSGDAPAPVPAEPRLAEKRQQSEAPPPVSEDHVDYSEDPQWKKANESLHVVATDVVGKDDAHNVIHILATIAGYPSTKNVPVSRLLTMREFLRKPQWCDYYTSTIEPALADLHLAQTQEQK